jgi:hypothetical protein
MEDYNMTINWIWITRNLLILLYLFFYFLTLWWQTKYIINHHSFEEIVLNNFTKPFSKNLFRNSMFFLFCIIGIIVLCFMLTIFFMFLTGEAGNINLSILTFFISISYGVFMLVKQIYLYNKNHSGKL